MYKQILTLAVFGMVNLCILGTVVSGGEESAVNGGIEADGLSSDNAAIARPEAMPTDNVISSDMKDVVEMVDTLDILKRERAELEKLKSKYQHAEMLAEEKRNEESESKKEYKKKNESEVVLANQAKVENNEKPVNEQNIIISPDEKREIGEVTTLDNEDKNVQEIENIVKNGEEIVHPFEIAENLYKLGEYKLALEIYKLIDKNKIESEEEIWVLYQIANCYRKQELYDDAVKVYSKLRDGNEGTYWAKQAQWYIQDIEWRTKVEEKMVKVIGK